MFLMTSKFQGERDEEDPRGAGGAEDQHALRTCVNNETKITTL